MLDMPGDEIAHVIVQGKENLTPKHAVISQRSHFITHKDQANILQPNAIACVSPHDAQSPLPVRQSSPKQKVDGPTYFDADHRKRRKETSSPSESGTEADDENDHTLLRLPPPPSRPRKGLKSSDGSATGSPLLTPSYLDRPPEQLEPRSRESNFVRAHGPKTTEEETRGLKEKFRRRRRAELIRRVTETILLAAVGFVTCSAEYLASIDMLHWDWNSAGNYPWTLVTSRPSLELLAHTAVILGLYGVYPLRISIKNQARSISHGRSRFYIHIPAAFEPAPLLYPVLVPVFVALSLAPANNKVLLPNLILSIASVPSKIIPFNYGVHWYNSLHWTFSMLPLLICDFCRPTYDDLDASRDYHMHEVTDAEQLLLLYPLHHALLPALGYLTTSSLLPAELQMLSSSMINLLLLSDSPQAVILQSLLWLGGLCVFILCGKVLVWGVAIARIPTWRFRRPKSGVHRSNGIWSALHDWLNGISSKYRSVSLDPEISDSDEPQASHNRRVRRTHRRNRLGVYPRKGDFPMYNTLTESKMTASSLSDSDTQSRRPKDRANSSSPQSQSERRRRYTLPFGILAVDTLKQGLEGTWLAPSQPTKAWSFRSLTRSQSIVLRRLFATYIYVTVIGIIAFAVRPYIGRYAMHEQEPVGWALGFLLGELPFIRQYIFQWDLEHWIYLPPSVPAFFRSKSYNMVSLSTGHLGAANTRLIICIYCLIIITAGLTVVFRLSALADVDTRRKVFHGMMVAMFLPTIFIDPTFISLALILILAVFLLLDLFRASQLPPLSRPLTYFLAPYVDGRDHRGPIIVSHIFLLIGCAIPLWLSLAAIERRGVTPWEGWDLQRREMSMISGVVCVGMGDAAASLIGRRFGRRRWCWSGGKSLEGSLAFAVAVILGLAFARWWLLLGSWDGDYGDAWISTLAKAAIAASGASLTEAVLTGGNDNVIVPVILWLLVRGLKL